MIFGLHCHMYIDVTKNFNSSKFKMFKFCYFWLTYINISLFSIFFFYFICWSCFVAFFACIVDWWVGVVVEYQIVYQFNDSHI